MLSVARICRASVPVAKASFLSGTSQPTSAPLRIQLWRNMSNDGRDSFSRTARRRRTLKEIAMEPTEGTPFAIGKAAIAGGSVVGLGALCFYGLGLASKPGAIDQSMLWPEYVKERIKSTYAYLGGSIAFTAISAVACFRSPTMIRMMSQNSFLAIAGTMAAMIGTGMVARSIPYQPGFGAKQLAWMVHTGVIGAVIAPMCLMAGPLAIRAAWYTAGVVGGLSAVAVCAPSDKFLNMTGPLAIGLGVVFVSSLGSMFLKTTEKRSNIEIDIKIRRTKYYRHIQRLPATRLTKQIHEITTLKSTTDWVTNHKVLQKANIKEEEIVDRERDTHSETKYKNGQWNQSQTNRNNKDPNGLMKGNKSSSS